MNAIASLTNAQRAEAFAAEVRSHLSDLPAEELDDLLDGLGADLEERLGDGDELGDAQGYAEELRQAAGLPPRVPGDAPRATVAERTAAARERVALWFAETPARQAFRDFAISVRPLWWVLRAVIGAWALFLIVGAPLVNGLPLHSWGIVLTLALIVLSVQWGRGLWLPRPWIRGLRTAANVAAVVLLLPFLVASWAVANAPQPEYITEDIPAEGILSNGEQVTNIFAYDCEGNPLDSVRLYDQLGNPLSTLGPEYSELSEPPESSDAQGMAAFRHGYNPLAVEAQAWNVFPLSAAPRDEATGLQQSMAPAKPPRSHFPPLARDCAAPAGGADTSGSSTLDDEAAGADAAETDPKDTAAAPKTGSDAAATTEAP